MLHRAFSVFLFTPEGRLVMQQRALSKITFAGIWANTCCSHPLADSGEEEERSAAGVVRAAQRKLAQELGIAPADILPADFTWVTRVHYAGVSAPSSEAALWGEHEIDWILLCKPSARAALAPNPNEVADVREFSQAELRAWMASGGAERVSPWFGVMERSGLLYSWWDAVLADRVDTVLDRDTIHRQHDLEARAAGAAAGSVAPARALEASRCQTESGGAAAAAHRR